MTPIHTHRKGPVAAALMQRLSSESEQLNIDIRLDWQLLVESMLRRRLLIDLAISVG